MSDASFWALEMARLRDIQPSPLKQMFGPSPSLSQTNYHRDLMRVWESGYRRARKLWKAASEEQRNPTGLATKKRTVSVDVKRAAARYKRFTGQEPKRTGKITVPALPRAVVAIGYIDELAYETMREGRIQRFRHTFARHARPLFCASPDGRQLLMLGGAFRFTDRGIVDRKRRR